MKGLMRLIVSFFVLVVDGLYGDRPYARFYALETIAPCRSPKSALAALVP